LVLVLPLHVVRVVLVEVLRGCEGLLSIGGEDAAVDGREGAKRQLSFLFFSLLIVPCCCG
jgi:hypothetical protein